MTRLEEVFQETFCTDAAPVGTTVVCGCGQTYTARPEDAEPLLHGTVSNMVLVRGCPCATASSFGNLFWQYRHQIAAFLRGMHEALQSDAERMLRVLPDLEEKP